MQEYETLKRLVQEADEVFTDEGTVLDKVGLESHTGTSGQTAGRNKKLELTGCMAPWSLAPWCPQWVMPANACRPSAPAAVVRRAA